METFVEEHENFVNNIITLIIEKVAKSEHHSESFGYPSIKLPDEVQFNVNSGTSEQDYIVEVTERGFLTEFNLEHGFGTLTTEQLCELGDAIMQLPDDFNPDSENEDEKDDE